MAAGFRGLDARPPLVPHGRCGTNRPAHSRPSARSGMAGGMTSSDHPVSGAPSGLAAALLELFEDGVPAVLRGTDMPFSTQEVFDWVKAVHPPKSCQPGAEKIDAVKRSWGLSPGASRDPSSVEPGRPLELYRGGAMLLDASPFVPTDAHASFDAWVDASRAELGDDFGVMAPNIECASWNALGRLQALLAPTLARTGPRNYRYNAFFGDYRRTPFGYHLDPHQECVFQFVLEGTRKASFWEGLTLGDEDAGWIEDTNRRTQPARRAELVVDLEPGDVVFWPGTHLHGFDIEGPSMGLSLVIDRASPRSRQDVVAGLEVATLGGRAALPRVEEGLELDPAAALRRRPHARLAFECHDDDLIVGVCGRTFAWPDRTSQGAALPLLNALRTRETTSADALSREFSDKHLTREDIAGLLSMLAGLGYFDRTP